MSWITLTTDDVKNYLSGPEYSALGARALVSGQSSPVPAIMADVTADVRGYVAACNLNRLDADTTTVPGELKTAALDLIVMRLVRRLNLKMFDSSAFRLKAEENALNKLRDVAAGKFAIVQPDTPAAEPPDNPGTWGGDATIDM